MPTAPACPGSLTTKPRVCDNHRRPPRSSRRCLTAVDTRPSAPPKVPIGAPRRRESPPATVPLRPDPERSSGLVRMRFRFTPSRSPTGTNLRPPNRPNPVGLIRPPGHPPIAGPSLGPRGDLVFGQALAGGPRPEGEGNRRTDRHADEPTHRHPCWRDENGEGIFWRRGSGRGALPRFQKPKGRRHEPRMTTSLTTPTPHPSLHAGEGRIARFRRPTWAGKPVPRARASPPVGLSRFP